jgi:Plasmid pRiA4b ORF-3-like protein
MPRYLELDVSLVGIRPKIWRRLWIRADLAFIQLHYAIQAAMGWDGEHLWEFSTAGRRGESIAGPVARSGWGSETPDASRTKLTVFFGQGAPSRKCAYVYDFGDHWVHEVHCRRGFDLDEMFAVRLVDGARRCPPEDCGGIWGYQRLCALGRGEVDPKEDPERVEMWKGWDPEAFDLEATKRFFKR